MLTDFGKHLAKFETANEEIPFTFETVSDSKTTGNFGDMLFDSAELTIITLADLPFDRDAKIVIGRRKYIVTTVQRLPRKFTLGGYYTRLTLRL